jgi:hypothetical protein
VLTADPGVDTAKKLCCVGANTACTGDFDCCGFLTCKNHACTQQPDGEYCLTNGDCQNADCDTSSHLCTSGAAVCTGGLPPGPQSSCSNDDQCCGNAACAPLQSQGGALRCCMPGSQSCTLNSDCCGTMVCGAGKTCVCKAMNETCLSDEDCCTNLACAGGKCLGGGTTGPTVNPGGSCTSASDCTQPNSGTYTCPASVCCTTDPQILCVNSNECCGGHVCDYNSPTPGANKVCCGALGGTCRFGFSNDCCGDLICDGTGHCINS